MTAAIAAVIVAVDQATKVAVRSALPTPGASVPVFGDVVRLTMVQNWGAAFGMGQGGRFVFIIVSTLALCVIAAYLIRRRPQHVWLVVALGFVAGGAAGNLIDRALFGPVTDFIQIPFDFPVFNVADSAVVIGVGMLVWWLLFAPDAAPRGSESADLAAVSTGPDPRQDGR